VSDRGLIDEANRPAGEPWLPAETWLVSTCLALGVVLLAVLLWLTATPPPAG
jgi:hypothetical protein